MIDATDVLDEMETWVPRPSRVIECVHALVAEVERLESANRVLVDQMDELMEQIEAMNE